MSNPVINSIKVNGQTYDIGATISPYRIEALPVKDGDVIILHLADNLDFDDIAVIQKDIQKDFPNNKVICANDHILKSITVLQKTDTENIFGIDLSLDGEWMF